MNPIKSFAPEVYASALEAWAWVGLDGRTPVFANLFGDLFLLADDGYWFLDTLEGSLTRVWPDKDALVADLDALETQDHYLLGGLASAAHEGGLVLGDDEVYDFKIPPVLGGSTTVENIAVQDFVVKMTIAGSIHDQVRNLPPGTPVTEIRIV